jgi:hypothetical protein
MHEQMNAISHAVLESRRIARALRMEFLPLPDVTRQDRSGRPCDVTLFMAPSLWLSFTGAR